MVKFHNKTVLGLTILAMLATSPMSVSYTFAENFDGFEQKIPKSTNMDGNLHKSIITEKIVDGKLEVKRFALPENVSRDDMNRMISFEGETSGWAYVNQNSYQSGIILYDGKVIKIGKNLWEISKEKMDKNILDSDDFIHETNTNEEFGFRIVFSGKAIEAGSETFAVIFTNPSLKGPDAEVVNLAKITESMTNYSNTNSNVFRNSILVG